MTIFIVADRRLSVDGVIKLALTGKLNSIYVYKTAAEEAKFPTEKVWELTIDAKLAE